MLPIILALVLAIGFWYNNGVVNRERNYSWQPTSFRDSSFRDSAIPQFRSAAAAVEAFLQNGGTIKKCPTHSIATGNIRFHMNPTRRKDS